MANTSWSLNIHCIFSAKEHAPMLNPELKERLWAFLGGIAKQNGVAPRCGHDPESLSAFAERSDLLTLKMNYPLAWDEEFDSRFGSRASTPSGNDSPSEVA
jgi:hypothetical protein